MTDNKTLLELTTKTLCDIEAPTPSDASYLFAQTTDNQISVLDAGARLVRQGKTLALWIPDSGPRCGYPGFDLWKKELLQRKVAEDKIIGVPTTVFKSLNTYTEALATVRYCKDQTLSTLTIMASPFHQLRAFISTVSALSRELKSLRVFNSVGDSLPWYEMVSHSQGSLRGMREEFIDSEMARIDKYETKGDLVSPAEALEYLRNRDREPTGENQ